MATYSYVSIGVDEVPEAERLIDLTSINRDVTMAAECAQKAISALGRGECEHAEVLMLGAFVRYGRCFKNGVRNAVRDELKAIVGSDPAHQEACDIRDGAFAHSIGHAENYDVRVWLNPLERGGPSILNVNVAEERVAFDHHYVRALVRLCDTATAWLGREIEKEQARIRSIIEARFEIADLYRRSAAAAGTVTLKNARTSRKPRQPKGAV